MGSSWIRNWTRVSCTGGGFFTTEPPGKPCLTFTGNCLPPSLRPPLPPGRRLGDVWCRGQRQPREQRAQVLRSRRAVHRRQSGLAGRSHVVGEAGFLVRPGPGLSGRGDRRRRCRPAGSPSWVLLASSPDWAEDADQTSSSDTWFLCLYLKEMNLPRGLLCLAPRGPVLKTQGEEGPPLQGRTGAATASLATGPLPGSWPLGRPGDWMSIVTHAETGTTPGALPAMEYRKRFLNQSFMCIAPNHVLLLISFGYSRISPPLFRTPLPWFPACSWRRSFVWYTPPEAESVLEVSSKISLSLQDCIITVTYTVTDVSQSSHFVTDPKSVRICKQGSKQKIFFFHVNNNFFKKVQFALQQSVLNHLHKRFNNIFYNECKHFNLMVLK